MPEYLAPGVYVEEIDTGSKPIEGVSTSTAGMVGVTERGPVNVPILITSYGEFTRWFGGYLDPAVFSNTKGRHCYLPHAVEGFFTNGGKRVYVVRVAHPNATAAFQLLFDHGTPGVATTEVETWLFRRAPGGSPNIYVFDNPAGLSAAPPPTLRIGVGSDAEYLPVAAAPNAANANHISLRLPLAAKHAANVVVNRLSPAPAVKGAALNLIADAHRGDLRIRVNTTAALAQKPLLRIGTVDWDDEYIFVEAANPATNEVTLRMPLRFEHVRATGVVQPMTGGTQANATTLDGEAFGGDTVIFVPLAARANYTTSGNFIEIGVAPNNEVCRIGQIGWVESVGPAYADYPIGSIVTPVTVADAPVPSSNKALAEDSAAGSTVITLDARQNLAPGDVVRVGAANDPNAEFVVISSISDPGPPPNGGRVYLQFALRFAHAVTTVVRRQDVTPANPAVAVTVLALPARLTNNNRVRLTLSGSDGLAQNQVVRIRVPSGDEYFHPLITGPTNLTPVPVTLNANLQSPHAAGDFVGNRGALLEVHALDPGLWGNRLRVSVQDQDPPLLRTQIRTTANGVAGIVDATHLRLESINGAEIGTMLQRTDANGRLLHQPFKVIAIDRQANNLLTIDVPLPATALEGDWVRSLEFQLNIILLRQPDPAVPGRSEMIQDFESFRYLSVDQRHSRYVERVIGTTWTPPATADEARPPRPLRLEDRRSEGESRYVRVYDLGKDVGPAPGEPDATLNSRRLGPELLMEVRPDGRRTPALRVLGRAPGAPGDDALPALVDDVYVGTDNPEPLNRTGLFALRNEESISIVAIPGRTSLAIQNAVINHCELMRYRFAVLDAHRTPQDSLNNVQNQRAQFDTKYAALYHPWPLIPDPFPTNLAEVADYPIPPSGHITGVYARTDIERGVHKAPANEVLRGVTGLQRLLNKGEQDILNPYPVNINVIRDFRPNNRGIRVWGGRVITSDPDWKYVNVRRLLIFIEASIDRGLQWVVFEPNAEPLWARVHRTVSNFLTSVWRDGALEGTKPEEAYFVKVDRTTMTQTDIDNGKLIVVIGVAPVKPAEFVIIRIGLWTAHADT